ncbi:MAG TPA: hypothetical protein VLE23_07620, partial [Geminicoccaceae bacterium]|nr:hypothetical protein [Geminicoccaceae bacterium]
MDPTDYLRFLAALAFVLGLIALLAWAARRFRLGSAAPRAALRSRLTRRSVLLAQARRSRAALAGPGAAAAQARPEARRCAAAAVPGVTRRARSP